MNLLRDLPNVLRRKYSLPLAHALIRTHATDGYIVSFPRSASTWLRTILAGLIDPEAGADPEVFNRILPGASGQWLPLVWSLPDPRIIHSYTTFRAAIPKAVHVVCVVVEEPSSVFTRRCCTSNVNPPLNIEITFSFENKQ